MKNARPTEAAPSANTQRDFTQAVQEPLPGFERPIFAPVMPSAGTRPAEALAMLIANQCIDQRDFLAMHAGWRLAAAVFELRALGWRILSHHAPVILDSGECVHIARYSLDRSNMPSSQVGFIAPGLACWLAAVAPLFVVGLLLLSRYFG